MLFCSFLSEKNVLFLQADCEHSRTLPARNFRHRPPLFLHNHPRCLLSASNPAARSLRAPPPRCARAGKEAIVASPTPFHHEEQNKIKIKSFVHARSYVFYVLFFFLPNSTAPPTRWAPRDAGSVGAPVRALSLCVSRLQSARVIIGTSDGRHDASLEKRARKSLALFAPFFPARRRRHPFFFSPPTARFSSFDFCLLLG